jgi:AraC-like DNA-binding protein
MVNNGQNASKRTAARRKSSGALARATFAPPQTYALDIEILSANELRRRIIEQRFRRAHQINFYLMMLVESGRCKPVVDYTPLPEKKGSLLLVRPNQALKLDLSSSWEGWITIFRPEYLALVGNDLGGDFFLVEEMQGLPALTQLNEASRHVMSSLLALMREDARSNHPQPLTNAMLRFQLKSLLLRLLMLSNKTRAIEPNSTEARRFRRFRALIEESYTRQHKLAHYASQLGCTVKSLSRATLGATGTSAKQYIAARINLEAKRLLTHTQMPISAIAERLGFDEATNFVKFFKRDCGLPPSEFRKQHYSIYN